MATTPIPPGRLKLYVPHPESRLCNDLARGSAIVGVEPGGAEMTIFYEGNTIGAANLRRYRARVDRASHHLMHEFPKGYPTKARAEVDVRELIEIGGIDLASGAIEIDVAAGDLAWWLDAADLEDLGLAPAI